MNNLDKNIKGITLISLVITIIILIILAGVAVNLTLGENGIFRRAREAREKYLTAEEQEEQQLNKVYAYLNETDLPENTPKTNAGTMVKIPNNWKEYNSINMVSTENGDIVETKKIASTVYAVSDGKNNTIPVPIGFYYVGGTKESGVVISDNPKDQNKYVNFTNNDEVLTGIPAGAIYKEDGTVKQESELSKEEKKVAILGNQFVWIPCTIVNYIKQTDGFGEYNTGWAQNDISRLEELQIEKYGGFYVGRYEAGTSNIELGNGYDFTKGANASSWENDNFAYTNVTNRKNNNKSRRNTILPRRLFNSNEIVKRNV